MTRISSQRDRLGWRPALHYERKTPDTPCLQQLWHRRHPDLLLIVTAHTRQASQPGNPAKAKQSHLCLKEASVSACGHDKARANVLSKAQCHGHRKEPLALFGSTVAVSAQEVNPCAEANGTPRALIRASCKHIQVASSTYLRAMLVPRALTDASRKHKSRSRHKSEESKKVGATQIRRSSLRLLMLIASTHVRVLCTSG